MSHSLAAASFGRGVRWLFCSVEPLQWSIAVSLPLGVLAAAFIVAVPSLLDGSRAVDWSAWAPLLGAWLVGLVIQVVVTQVLFSIPKRSRFGGDPVRDDSGDDSLMYRTVLTIGGVWMAIPDIAINRNQPSWLETFAGASRVLALWSLLLLSLGAACLGCLLVDTLLASAPDSAASSTATTAAVAAMDRPWVIASWMFCLQGFWQLLPIPQALGRVGWSAAIGLFARHPDPHANDRSEAIFAVRRVQWWIVAIALSTLLGGVMAIQLSGISSQAGGRVWPALSGVTLLALWLFISARGQDLLASQMILAANGETGVLHSRIGIGPAYRRWQAERQQRARTRKLLEVAKRERDEANDAAQVDEILQRLHTGGPDSLSDEEHAILSRVSEAIRQTRARDQNPKP
ncbi:hypothetical protein [Allorhodopirellula solitaria]|uniref:hypothetical protein n=1 Tax=Allorhodopirellula solitaria TaxID=2527987 RepID=UPI001FE9E592|nr:hypothetical protein [Allorhodopirellula solitaria]